MHYRPGNLKEFFLYSYIWAIISLLTPLLKLFKLPQVLQLLTPKHTTHSKWEVGTVVALTDSILAAEWFIYRRNCLKRSLTLYYFLSRLGLPIQINLGVRKEDKNLEGHGWLTLEGRPYLEPNDKHPDFQVVYCFPQEA